MYENLIKEMAAHSITKEAIANLLSLSRDTIRLKCRGKVRFYYDEAVRIRDAFFPDKELEDLFDTAQLQEYKAQLHAGAPARPSTEGGADAMKEVTS